MKKPQGLWGTEYWERSCSQQRKIYSRVNVGMVPPNVSKDQKQQQQNLIPSNKLLHRSQWAIFPRLLWPLTSGALLMPHLSHGFYSETSVPEVGLGNPPAWPLPTWAPGLFLRTWRCNQRSSGRAPRPAGVLGLHSGLWRWPVSLDLSSPAPELSATRVRMLGFPGGPEGKPITHTSPPSWLQAAVPWSDPLCCSPQDGSPHQVSKWDSCWLRLLVPLVSLEMFVH